MFAVWIMRLRNFAPSVTAPTFVDDSKLEVPSDRVDQLRTAIVRTEAFHMATGQRTQYGKTKVILTNSGQSEEVRAMLDDVPGGHQISIVSTVRALGVDLGLSPLVTARARKAEVFPMYKRVATLPVGFENRSLIIQTKVHQSLCFGSSHNLLPMQDRNELRTAAMLAVWGPKRQLRSIEVVMTLLRKGHLVDPLQAALYRVVVESLFVLRRGFCDLDLFRLVWQTRCEYNPRSSTDLVAHLLEVFRCVGWQWRTPFVVFTGRRELHLLDSPVSFVLHDLRDDMRFARWRLICNRGNQRARKDMAGIDDRRIDVFATTLLLRGKASVGDACDIVKEARRYLGKKLWDSYHRGMLEGIISGSIRTRHRLDAAVRANRLRARHPDGRFEASIAGPHCVLCGHPDEDHDHVFWCMECNLGGDPATPSCALPDFFDDLVQQRVSEPTCWAHCGIQLVDAALQAAHDALSGLPSVACASFAFPSLIDPGVQTRYGRILVWTDGSCLFPTISLLARVGVGVHYAVDSPCNVSVGLPGPDQSNNRAELTAIAIVVASSTSPVDIRTDSKWAADRLRWLQEDASRFPLHSWSHIDIWRQIHGSPNFRRRFDHQGVSCPWCVFKWIKGHATAEDVAAGIISARDRAGNYAADNLAGAAATAASPDTAACDSYFSRLRCTVMLQAWMLKRWATRAKYLRHYQPAHYDDDDDPLDDAWHDPNDDDSHVRVRSAQSIVGDVALDAGHSNVGGSLGSGARPSHSASRQRPALTSDQLKEAARFSGENMLYGILDVDWDTRQTVWPAWPWHLVSGNVNAYTFPIHSDSATDWPIAHIPFAAIDWYFRSLQWCESEGCSVTAQELAIDFYGSTHVNVIPQTSSRQDPTIENMTRFFVIAWTSYCRLIGSTVTHGTWRLKSLKQVRAFGIRESSGIQGARPIFLSGDFVPRVIYHRMAAWSTSSGLSHDRRTGAWKCSIPVAAALPCRIWDSSATLVQPSRKRIHAKSSSSVSPCLSHAHAVVLPIGCVASSFAVY